jgi:hypothetical protein
MPGRHRRRTPETAMEFIARQVLFRRFRRSGPTTGAVE